MPAVAVRRSRHDAIRKQLSSPRVNLEKIAYSVTEHPRLLPVLVDGLNSGDARVKFASAKALRLASERAPHLLYRHFESLARLLDNDNAILRWDAAHILANLAPVDYQERLERILDRYMDPITDREMIGAANCIEGAARIAQAKPHLADSIAQHILKVEHGIYKTPECRNVAIGHAIAAFDEFFREIAVSRHDVIEFVQRQLKNPRAATVRKAEAFLKKWAE